MAEHSVFSGAPPWEPTAHNDGDPTIVTSAAFYSVASAWTVLGGRFRVPVGGSAIFPAQVTVSLHIAPLFTLVDLSDPAVASATANVADGWCEARWPGVLLAVGQAAWISIQGIGSQDVYLFVGVGAVGVPAVQADDASDLYLAEAGTSPPLEQPRAAFLSGGVTTLSQAWYGIDIIVEEPAVEVTGESTLSAVFGVVADGQVAMGSDATLAGTFSAAATGLVAGGGDASLNAQVAILATGTIEAAPEANLAITVSLSAIGVVSGNPGFCEPLTVTLTGPELTVILTGPELTVEVTAC